MFEMVFNEEFGIDHLGEMGLLGMGVRSGSLDVDNSIKIGGWFEFGVSLFFAHLKRTQIGDRLSRLLRKSRRIKAGVWIRRQKSENAVYEELVYLFVNLMVLLRGYSCFN